MTLVVDASVALKWFLDEPLREEARQVMLRDEALHAPDLLIAEAANAVWKRMIRGDIDQPQALAIITALHRPFTSLFPATELCERALEIALDQPSECHRFLGDRQLRDSDFDFSDFVHRDILSWTGNPREDSGGHQS